MVHDVWQWSTTGDGRFWLLIGLMVLMRLRLLFLERRVAQGEERMDRLLAALKTYVGGKDRP